MRNRKFEEYMLNNTWNNRIDIITYHIFCVPLENEEFYIGFTGVQTKTACIKETDAKASGKMYYLLSGNYNFVKESYLDLIMSEYLSDKNICDKPKLDEIKSIFLEIYK